MFVRDNEKLLQVLSEPQGWQAVYAYADSNNGGGYWTQAVVFWAVKTVEEDGELHHVVEGLTLDEGDCFTGADIGLQFLGYQEPGGSPDLKAWREAAIRATRKLEERRQARTSAPGI